MSFFVGPYSRCQIIGEPSVGTYHFVPRICPDCGMAPLLQDRGAVGFKPDASWQAEAEGFAPCLRCAS